MAGSSRRLTTLGAVSSTPIWAYVRPRSARISGHAASRAPNTSSSRSSTARKASSARLCGRQCQTSSGYLRMRRSQSDTPPPSIVVTRNYIVRQRCRRYRERTQSCPGMAGEGQDATGKLGKMDEHGVKRQRRAPPACQIQRKSVVVLRGLSADHSPDQKTLPKHERRVCAVRVRRTAVPVVEQRPIMHFKRTDDQMILLVHG